MEAISEPPMCGSWTDLGCSYSTALFMAEIRQWLQILNSGVYIQCTLANWTRSARWDYERLSDLVLPYYLWHKLHDAGLGERQSYHERIFFSPVIVLLRNDSILEGTEYFVAQIVMPCNEGNDCWWAHYIQLGLKPLRLSEETWMNSGSELSFLRLSVGADIRS